MKIVRLTKDKIPLWDAFVDKHSDATMYHLSGWKTVFESVFGYSPYYLMAMDSANRLQGVLPMFCMSDLFRRKYLISNPFSNFAGICANSAEAADALYDHAVSLAKELNARYVELRQLGKKVKSDLPSKESFVTLMLELGSDSDLIWRSISSRNRNKVRKAGKNGLNADFGLQYLDSFYEIYARNLRHLGTPVFPADMFRAVAKTFSDRVELLVLKLDGRPVSGMFLFKFQKTISEPWVASLRQYNKIYINNCLYWHAIKYACEHGFEVFDFGRSTVDTGTYKFKEQILHLMGYVFICKVFDFR